MAHVRRLLFAFYQESLLITFFGQSVCVECVCVAEIKFIIVAMKHVFQTNHNKKKYINCQQAMQTHLSRNGVADVESELET